MIHTSDAILDKLEEWHERNLRIFTLPTYSPQLNLIEILWRFIKYEWLKIDAYSSWESLVASVEKILKEFGESRVSRKLSQVGWSQKRKPDNKRKTWKTMPVRRIRKRRSVLARKNETKQPL